MHVISGTFVRRTEVLWREKMRKVGESDTRQRILNFIREFLREQNYAPTVREIQRGCNISSTAVVQHHLKVLQRQGYIHRQPELARNIQLLGGGRRFVSVPLLGVIAAGEPIPVPSSDTWFTAALETLELTEEVTGGKEVYALKVKGLSMIDALVDDGDTVLVQPSSNAEDGEMVVVWLKREQEVTLKRIYRELERVRLQPANRQMQPIYCEPENVEIQGKVVGVIRKL